MATKRITDGDWEIDQFGPYFEHDKNVTVVASRNKRGKSEVELSSDTNDTDPGLTISINEGSGFMSQHCSAFIPLSVLRKLLEIHDKKENDK